MENENNENIYSSIDTETTVNTTTLTVDDYNRLLDEKKALEDKNAKLYARIKKSESSPKETPLDTSSQLTEQLTRLKLRVEHGIDDPEAIDFIMKNGGETALGNQYMKTAVDTILQQKRAEKAVEGEESSKSEFEKKYSTSQLQNMSSEELEKILPHN